jgi:hypothetical protein
MKAISTISLILVFGIISCRKPYDPHLDTGQQVMVVDGFLSNVAGTNYVSLSWATPFDKTVTPTLIRNARVFLTDNSGNVINYKEYSPGYYKPLDISFAGAINKTYTLKVETPDGKAYVSKPEVLMPLLSPVKVSGGYNQEEVLVDDPLGGVDKQVKDVCEVFYDFAGDQGITPRFRFTSSQFVEYIINKVLIPPKDLKASYLFYCWLTEYDYTLRFTNEKYPTSSTGITKQTVSITNPDRYISVFDMDLKTMTYSDSIVTALEYKRIIKINQYRLNTDSYTYYKGIESQSAAEGKMFDPLTTQLYGNMTCKSDSTQLVLGLFEASSVSTYSYAISRHGVGTPVIFEIVPNMSLVTPLGFTIDSIPKFWIN